MQGQAAQVHAYGNVYRPYGDQWRGRKSVHPEVDRNGEQLTDKNGNVEDALSGQVMVCRRSASFFCAFVFLHVQENPVFYFVLSFCFNLPPVYLGCGALHHQKSAV